MNYLIATHGEFSKGIIDAVHLIAGEDIQLDYFSMSKSKSAESAEIEVRKYLKEKKGQPLIVLTDVFGGSVANLFTSLLLEDNSFQLVTGVSLPMILSMVLTVESDSQMLVSLGIEEAKKGIVHVNELLLTKGGIGNDDIIIED
ncbi:PTS mannose transporter subunit IIA [Enterococcus saccharolyticus]|uniref:PTS mannose transporter subunit IIA n=1 Tax=Candidatus Enterococcus willemsii TaxID=1857215 RepID=A0ABQ6Z330_9ENTE|nr:MULTISPECIES: PTS mannose transporter subunit IIA [Enterococcus]KAF1306067.1 PTS mannose transporter subunit IIA [Enterococcus sp. CU12B]MCD5002336.1 PTS mannose transporter subunit IIA [Enterococcus saccharolyticus]